MAPGKPGAVFAERELSKEVYETRIKIHQSEYITERDFVTIRRMGMEIYLIVEKAQPKSWKKIYKRRR